MPKSPTGSQQASSSTVPSTPQPERKPYFQAPFNLSEFKPSPSSLSSRPSDPLQPSPSSLAHLPSAPEIPTDEDILAQQRCASTLSLLSRWEKIAAKYKDIALEDDDEILLSTMEVVKNRGVLEGGGKMRFGETMELSSGEESEGEAEETEQDAESSDSKPIQPTSNRNAEEYDELDSWGPQSLDIQISRAVPDILKPVVISTLPKPAKVPAWTVETNADLREFLRAEEERRAACGEKAMDEEESDVEDENEDDQGRGLTARDKGKGREMDRPRTPEVQEYIPVHMRGTIHLSSPVSPSPPSSSRRKPHGPSPSPSSLQQRIRELGLDPSNHKVRSDGKRHIIDLSIRDDDEDSDVEVVGEEEEEDDPFSYPRAGMVEIIDPSWSGKQQSRREELPWQPKIVKDEDVKEDIKATIDLPTGTRDEGQEVPIKKRGRQLGSKNKPKVKLEDPIGASSSTPTPPQLKRSVGRPRRISGSSANPSPQTQRPDKSPTTPLTPSRPLALPSRNELLPTPDLLAAAGLKPKQSKQMKNGARVDWVVVVKKEERVGAVKEAVEERGGRSLRRRKEGVEYNLKMLSELSEWRVKEEDTDGDESGWVDDSREEADAGLSSPPKAESSTRRSHRLVEIHKTQSYLPHPDIFSLLATSTPKQTSPATTRKEHRSFFIDPSPPSTGKTRGRPRSSCVECVGAGREEEAKFCKGRKKGMRCEWLIKWKGKGKMSDVKTEEEVEVMVVDEQEVEEESIRISQVKVVVDYSPQGLSSRRTRRPITLSPETEDEAGPSARSEIVPSSVSPERSSPLHQHPEMSPPRLERPPSPILAPKLSPPPRVVPPAQPNTMDINDDDEDVLWLSGPFVDPSLPVTPSKHFNTKGSPSSLSKRKRYSDGPASALKRLRFDDSPGGMASPARAGVSSTGSSPLGRKGASKVELIEAGEDVDELMLG